MSSYKYILFPGRHHILTTFQHQYLSSLIKQRGKSIKTLSGRELRLDDHPSILWIITSANHSNTRRNPLSASKREAMIERFSEDIPAESFIFSINDLGTTARFADHIIKEVEVQSRGRITVTPSNTLVACSTPAVFHQYQELGYEVLPVELVSEESPEFSHLRPWDIVNSIVRAGKKWRVDRTYLSEVHPACRAILEKYDYGDLILDLYHDPLVGEEGDITETRDYETYRKAFDDGAERKYEQVRNLVRSGRIVDIGCATGSIIKQLAADERLRESDIYGIEVARKLYDLCEQRKANGEFNNENVFFYQRNIAQGAIFPKNSINTTLTFSLTHEIESYLGRKPLLRLIKQIYQQTAPGGVYINVDVIGPSDKDVVILAKLNKDDGKAADEVRREFAESHDNLSHYLDSLSTHARFEEFAKDFRAVEGDKIEYQIVTLGGSEYVKTKLEYMAEFMSKKDYTDNWLSEMHERFCFWSFEDWQTELTKVGFTVSRDSKTYQNPWIVKNRFENKVELYKLVNEKATKIPYPPTNVVLVAEKLS